MLFFSSFFSLLALSAILAIQGKLGEIKKASVSEIRHSAILGFMNPFFYYLILFKAYSLLPAQQAQPLNFTWGVVIALLSIPILKQKVRTRDIAAVFVSFFGVVVIATQGNLSSFRFNEPLGVFLAVGSSLLWSFYWIFNAKDKRDPVVKLFLNFCFGFSFVAIFLFLSGDFVIPPVEGIIGSVYIGFFEMGITFVFWLRALEVAPSTAKISILIYLSPFLSFLFIHLFVGEKILTSSFVGLLFITGGILWQQSESIFKRRISKYC
jgi:drug/metabolite transporter (DMT)-like permease